MGKTYTVGQLEAINKLASYNNTNPEKVIYLMEQYGDINFNEALESANYTLHDFRDEMMYEAEYETSSEGNNENDYNN